MSVETIERAAILIDGVIWSVPRPKRHHNIIWLYVYDTTELPTDASEKIRRFPQESPQGFLTSNGRFVDRVEAKRIAVATGQYRCATSSAAKHIAHGGNASERGPVWESNELYSEDVW